MSAIENILVGEHSRIRGSWVEAILHTPRVVKEEKQAVEKARELLNFVGLVGLGDQLAKEPTLRCPTQTGNRARTGQPAAPPIAG